MEVFIIAKGVNDMGERRLIRFTKFIRMVILQFGFGNDFLV